MITWVSVNDYLPKENQRVLATDGKTIELVKFKGDYYLKNDTAWFIGEMMGDFGTLFNPEPYAYDKYLCKVTHWRKLPMLPRKKKPKKIDWISVEDEKPPYNDMLHVKIRDIGEFYGYFHAGLIRDHVLTFYDTKKEKQEGCYQATDATHWSRI